jgi:hypothetical protein
MAREERSLETIFLFSFSTRVLLEIVRDVKVKKGLVPKNGKLYLYKQAIPSASGGQTCICLSGGHRIGSSGSGLRRIIIIIMDSCGASVPSLPYLTC